MRKLTLILLATLLLPILTMAQTKEFDEIKQLPFVDKESMNILATSIWTLYQRAIKNPEQTSTSQAESETVYAYYDRNSTGKLDKVNPSNGKRYSIADTTELQKNNRLLFNLTFDVDGKLVIPNNVNVISNRWSEGRNYGRQIGFVAIELNIPDSVKQEFAKVKLKRLAKANINSLTGDISPVAIKIPFNISASQTEKVERIYGKVVKDKDRFQFSFTEAWNSIDTDGRTTASKKQDITEELKAQSVEVMKENSELSAYRNGSFTFILEKRTPLNNYEIDVNIMRDNMVWSSETQLTSTNTLRNTSKFKTLKFEGTGNKLKK